MISSPDNCLLQILITQCSWKKWRAFISLIGKTWQSPGSEQSVSTETAGFSHALCIGYSEETETGPKETVMSWDFHSGMQACVATQHFNRARTNPGAGRERHIPPFISSGHANKLWRTRALRSHPPILHSSLRSKGIPEVHGTVSWS